MTKTNVQLIIENAQLQQKLMSAIDLAEAVLNEGDDIVMIRNDKQESLSDAIRILQQCIMHFEFEQNDFEA